MYFLIHLITTKKYVSINLPLLWEKWSVLLDRNKYFLISSFQFCLGFILLHAGRYRLLYSISTLIWCYDGLKCSSRYWAHWEYCWKFQKMNRVCDFPSPCTLPHQIWGKPMLVPTSNLNLPPIWGAGLRCWKYWAPTIGTFKAMGPHRGSCGNLPPHPPSSYPEMRIWKWPLSWEKWYKHWPTWNWEGGACH
jgi:hypothetical protein